MTIVPPNCLKPPHHGWKASTALLSEVAAVTPPPPLATPQPALNWAVLILLHQATSLHLRCTMNVHMRAYQLWSLQTLDLSSSRRAAALFAVAASLTQARRLWSQGQAYWQQERHICAELASLQPGHPVNLSLADVLATHELKSFDYRVCPSHLVELFCSEHKLAFRRYISSQCVLVTRRFAIACSLPCLRLLTLARYVS